MSAKNSESYSLLPREKMFQYGTRALSDLELLAVLLGSGSRDRNVFQLARKVLDFIDQENASPDPEHLLAIDGIGPAKATLLCSVFEFMRRRIRPEGVRIQKAADILPLIQHYFDRKQEYLLTISLNGAYEVIRTRVVTVGVLNSCQVHPREVFADPITDRAAAIVIAHNHPSGSLEPGSQDKEVTEQIFSAGKILGIHLLDHIIFSKRGYFSFAENSLLESVK